MPVAADGDALAVNADGQRLASVGRAGTRHDCDPAMRGPAARDKTYANRLRQKRVVLEFDLG